MADVRQIIKKMREDGLPPEEAKASLRELGFTNADTLVNEIYGLPSTPKKLTPTEKTEKQGEKQSEEKVEEGGTEEGGREEGGGEEGEGKALFEGGEGRGLFEGEGEKAEEKGKAEVEEKPLEPEKFEIPELKITRVEGGEEKEVSIEEMLKSAAGEGVEPVLTKTEAASLKAKLDETISLLKALQEINKKILEAEREVLMRLKSSD